jgi:hypothetical protein
VEGFLICWDAYQLSMVSSLFLGMFRERVVFYLTRTRVINQDLFWYCFQSMNFCYSYFINTMARLLVYVYQLKSIFVAASGDDALPWCCGGGGLSTRLLLASVSPSCFCRCLLQPSVPAYFNPSISYNTTLPLGRSLFLSCCLPIFLGLHP